MAEERVAELVTVGVIARELAVPLEQVRQVLNNSPTIRPAARAGIIRVYRREVIETVRGELARRGTADAGTADGRVR